MAYEPSEADTGAAAAPDAAYDGINFDNPYLTLAESVRDQFVDWVKHNAQLIHFQGSPIPGTLDHTDISTAIADLGGYIDMSNFVEDGFEFAKLFKGQDGLSSLFEFQELASPWDNGLNMSGVVWYLSTYHSSTTASFWHDPTTNNEDGMPSLGQWAHFEESQESFARTWRHFLQYMYASTHSFEEGVNPVAGFDHDHYAILTRAVYYLYRAVESEESLSDPIWTLTYLLEFLIVWCDIVDQGPGDIYWHQLNVHGCQRKRFF